MDDDFNEIFDEDEALDYVLLEGICPKYEMMVVVVKKKYVELNQKTNFKHP